MIINTATPTALIASAVRSTNSKGVRSRRRTDTSNQASPGIAPTPTAKTASHESGTVTKPSSVCIKNTNPDPSQPRPNGISDQDNTLGEIFMIWVWFLLILDSGVARASRVAEVGCVDFRFDFGLMGRFSALLFRLYQTRQETRIVKTGSDVETRHETLVAYGAKNGLEKRSIGLNRT
jgi:hypothetical protein